MPPASRWSSPSAATSGTSAERTGVERAQPGDDRLEVSGRAGSPAVTVLSASRWALNQARLNLSVAVGADEDALFCLRAEGGNRLADRHGHRKRLPSGIDVVKVKIDDAAVVPTDGATATGLVREHPLHLLETTRHCLGDAALAAPLRMLSTLAVEGELRLAVPSAYPHLGLAAAIGIRRATLPRNTRCWRSKRPIDVALA
jgi:hypothetical protein